MMIKPTVHAFWVHRMAQTGFKLLDPIDRTFDDKGRLTPMSIGDQVAVRINNQILERAEFGAKQICTEVSEDAISSKDLAGFLCKLRTRGFVVKLFMGVGNYLVRISWA